MNVFELKLLKSNLEGVYDVSHFSENVLSYEKDGIKRYVSWEFLHDLQKVL